MHKKFKTHSIKRVRDIEEYRTNVCFPVDRLSSFMVLSKKNVYRDYIVNF